MAAPIVNVLAVLVCVLVCLAPGVNHAKKVSRAEVIKQISDFKEFKKVLRTHNNVLVIFAKSEKAVSHWDLYAEVAVGMKGLATFLFVDCGQDKKLCKKLKVSSTEESLKHYSEGEYNKDYDRKHTVKSLSSFLRDPKGEIPWEEDITAEYVVHLDNKQSLTTLLRKEKKPILVMFYAPWCGFCKKMKPDFAAAAKALAGEAIIAGMDVDKPDNMIIRIEYNITGFPTICYFERGQFQYRYGGENTEAGMISWMRNPTPPEEKEAEAEWADEDTDVVHLADDTFHPFIAEHPSVLVMFYAPWCGHCKKMKPEYVEAAAQLKQDEVEGIIAAVDATKHKVVGEAFKVKGFPTVKYFKNGEEAWDVNERTAEKIMDFMKDPKEPPPPPPEEAAWEDTPSHVEHLTDDTFQPLLKKKKHTLVMFYAPWCGHCKKAKPEFMGAAEQYKDDNKVAFAAVDCTKSSAICSTHEVSGYPTFKYLNYGKNAQKYAGGREEADFVNFMKDPLNPLSSAPPPPPSAASQWADVAGANHVHHLTDATFSDVMAQKDSALVMFYAPWCGHCKAMKPAYGEAAQILSEGQVNAALVAVDTTVEKSLGQRYEIKGFPTLKYFKNGVYQYDYERGRKTEDLVDFMKSPRASPPPPPAEPTWSSEESAVRHLEDADFTDFLASRDHVLVMFYAPWCGHCKRAKPEYQAAANSLGDSPTKALAAVDCTASTTVCSEQEVKGYPTFKYYHRGAMASPYQGGRLQADFLTFMESPPGAPQADPAPKEGEASQEAREDERDEL